jgi:hypothetical protein
MGGDACKDVGEPSLRIDTIHLGGDDQAIHGRGALSATIRSAEQPRLSPEGDASQSSFGGVVGETHATVFKEQSKARPSLQDVIERF